MAAFAPTCFMSTATACSTGANTSPPRFRENDRDSRYNETAAASAAGHAFMRRSG